MKLWNYTAAALLMLCPAWARWQQEIPDDVRTYYLDSDRVLSEDACDWRKPVTAIFEPAVRHCKTAREAVLHIAANMTKLTGAYYSADRRRQDMNACEALAEKEISCTGQTILMVCAFRSVGIPARAVGIPTWNHVPGNHTWPEVWLDGKWQMIEFNEKAFNTGWVMENIGMLDPEHPWQRILAQHPQGDCLFPVLGALRKPIAATDVTERYRNLATAWYIAAGMPANHQRLMLDIRPRQATPQTVKLVDNSGKVLEEQPLPTTRDDMRKFATFSLPRDGASYRLVFAENVSLPVTATPAPVQVLKLKNLQSTDLQSTI